MKVIILRGASGTGKSTYATFLQKEATDEGLVSEVVSADNYFMEDGIYKFDKSKLSEAHQSCMMHFLHEMEASTDLVIVDNTNTMYWELYPYVLVAHAFECEVEVHEMKCPVDIAVGRTVHACSPALIANQSSRMQPIQLRDGIVLVEVDGCASR